ncbi:hypothetical protein [Thorsellia anophelis]|uniref:hypothetical protein n=1 Tax=Thorsellia anophelis TaxID=336804 RepID=UPI0015A5D81F|nr:hypothetical protein [Thorsellia anophelis]
MELIIPSRTALIDDDIIVKLPCYEVERFDYSSDEILKGIANHLNTSVFNIAQTSFYEDKAINDFFCNSRTKKNVIKVWLFKEVKR